jgi:hypothetical protein
MRLLVFSGQSVSRTVAPEFVLYTPTSNYHLSFSWRCELPSWMGQEQRPSALVEAWAEQHAQPHGNSIKGD